MHIAYVFSELFSGAEMTTQAAAGQERLEGKIERHGTDWMPGDDMQAGLTGVPTTELGGHMASETSVGPTHGLRV